MEFRDTDAAGFVHFSVYFTYMEQTEHAFLRELGIRILDQHQGSKLSWPRVAASCDFLRPLTYDDEFEIVLRVERIGTRSVTYQCEFRLHDEQVALGRLTAVCCQIDPGAAPVAVAIPDEIIQRLQPYQVSP